MDPAYIDDLLRKEKERLAAERLRDANRPRPEIPRPTPPKEEPKKSTYYIQVL